MGKSSQPTRDRERGRDKHKTWLLWATDILILQPNLPILVETKPWHTWVLASTESLLPLASILEPWCRFQLRWACSTCDHSYCFSFMSLLFSWSASSKGAIFLQKLEKLSPLWVCFPPNLWFLLNFRERRNSAETLSLVPIFYLNLLYLAFCLDNSRDRKPTHHQWIKVWAMIVRLSKLLDWVLDLPERWTILKILTLYNGHVTYHPNHCMCKNKMGVLIIIILE